MARMRTVKASLRTSAIVAAWPIEVRYFFVMLWGYLDDEGRGLDIPKTISGDCFPHDDKIMAATIDRWLTLMSTPVPGSKKPPPVCRYAVDGRRYIHCPNWHEHQRVNRPSPSQHPRCPTHDTVTDPLSESISEGVVSRRVLELEGLKTREFEDTAGATQGSRRRSKTGQCPKHPGQLARNCGNCRGDLIADPAA